MKNLNTHEDFLKKKRLFKELGFKFSYLSLQHKTSEKIFYGCVVVLPEVRRKNINYKKPELLKLSSMLSVQI